MVYYALFTSPQVFHTKCMYSQCMPRAHLNDLWTNMCRLVSRHGACFWDCRFVHVQRSVKSVRRAKRTYYVERVRECERIFEPHRTRGYGCFSRRPRVLFASLGAGALSCTRHSWRRLHSVMAAFTLCLLFRLRGRLLALSSLLPS